MQIRKMIDADIEELALLYRQFREEDSSIEKMKQTFKMLEQDPRYIFLSAIKDNKLTGSVTGIICEGLYGNGEPFMIVEDFIVDKGSRRARVGTALLEELEQQAVDKKCCQIILVTENSREDALKFYAGMGYNPNTHTGFKKSLIEK
ncbi:MAG: GNAT family N-acetyltransferase [bacterium]|nr:GNAT family N-acetyltransferase [bacterium]